MCGNLSHPGHQGIRLDLGAWLFCAECARVRLRPNIRITKDYRMAVHKREDLRIDDVRKFQPAMALAPRLRRLFGQPLKLRQVSAGACNAGEADTNVLVNSDFKSLLCNLHYSISADQHHRR